MFCTLHETKLGPSRKPCNSVTLSASAPPYCRAWPAIQALRDSLCSLPAESPCSVCCFAQYTGANAYIRSTPTRAGRFVFIFNSTDSAPPFRRWPAGPERVVQRPHTHTRARASSCQFELGSQRFRIVSEEITQQTEKSRLVGVHLFHTPPLPLILVCVTLCPCVSVCVRQ